MIVGVNFKGVVVEYPSPRPRDLSEVFCGVRWDQHEDEVLSVCVCVCVCTSACGQARL